MRCAPRFCPSVFVAFIAAVLACPGSHVSARQTDLPQQGPNGAIVLDLATAIRLAQEQSYRMELADYSLQRSRFNLQASRAALKSNASMSFTIPDYDKSIKEITSQTTGLPIVLSTRAARYSGSISVRQPLPTNGVVSLNGVLNRTSDRLVTYTPGEKNYFGRVFLRYDQPILQPNRIQINIRKAELALEEAERGYQDAQIRLVVDISREYYDLFENTYSDQLAQEELARLEEMYAIGEQLFEDEIISEVNLLQLEVDLNAARDRASSAAGQLARQKDDFKQTIGLPEDEEIILEPRIEYAVVQYDVEAIYAQALEQRTDLRRTLIRRENHEMDLRERISDGRLQGNVSITLGLEGRGEKLGLFYDEMLDPDEARGVAMTFSLPLWDWGRNRAMVNSKQSEIDQNYRSEEEQRRTIRREVESAVARVSEGENRLELTSNSVRAAARSFDLTLQRFTEGEVAVQDVLLIQKQFADARESFMDAYIDFEEANIDLEAVSKGTGFGRGGGNIRF